MKIREVVARFVLFVMMVSFLGARVASAQESSTPKAQGPSLKYQPPSATQGPAENALATGGKTTSTKIKKPSLARETNSKRSPLDNRVAQNESPAPTSGVHQAIRASVTAIRPSQRVADEISVSIAQESYLNQSSPPAGVANYKTIGARLKTHSEGSFLTGYLEFAGSFAADVEHYNNIEVPEAFLHIEHDFGGATEGAEANSRALKAQLSVGRKREAWSQLDSDWMLGLWQPLNRFDALRSTEQGLTGAFASLRYAGLEVLAFGSTVYIPEQGQPFELQDGKFSSSSPWFSQPPDRMRLTPDQLEPSAVKYRMETPTIGSVINHDAVGFLLRAGSLDQGAYGQLTFVRKPRNTLSLPFDSHLALNDSSQNGLVTVYPQVAYHRLVGADLGYRSRIVSASVSALHEEVEEEDVAENLNRQTLEPMSLVSPKLEVRLFPSRFWGPRFTVSYLQTTGGAVTVTGPLPTGEAAFGPRTLFRQAVSVGAETLLIRSGRFRLNHGLRWIEELAESGTVLMTDVRMHFGDQWRLGFSADFLGSRQPVDQNETFIARYRGNDRVSGQLTYAF